MSTDTVSHLHHDSNVNNSSMTNSSSSYNHPNLDNPGETGHRITIDITLARSK